MLADIIEKKIVDDLPPAPNGITEQCDADTLFSYLNELFGSILIGLNGCNRANKSSKEVMNKDIIYI